MPDHVTYKAANEPPPPVVPLPAGKEYLSNRAAVQAKGLAGKVEKFAREHGIDGKTAAALVALVASEEKLSPPLAPGSLIKEKKEPGAAKNQKSTKNLIAAEGHEGGHGGHEGHGHHEEGAMPFFSMPEVLQHNGEEQAEVHIGWADIYLDLILVGVAFNGGLLLKHAFYLCTPPGEHGGEHGAEHGGAEHGPAHAKLESHAVHSIETVYSDAMPDYPTTFVAEHGVHFEGHSDHTGHIARMRMLSGHEHHEHGPCLGLPVGLLHVMAFGCPIIFAWLKDTIFRSRFHARSLSARGLECFCYLLMIIGASCEEDVTVLQSDGTFWYVFGMCMLTIDLTWLLRYGIIFFQHGEECARSTAKEQILILIPGSLLYLTAMMMALFPDAADDILGKVVPTLFGFMHVTSHTHIWYIPILFIVGANLPLMIEVFLFGCTAYKPALPINVHFVLHRATEVFMVLLGESVLQLITSQAPEQPPGTSEEEELAAEEKFAAVQIMGFVITLTIMHSFVITEPEPEYHVLNRGGVKSKLWLLLFITKALAVWLVGIGIKIALYDPNAAGDKFFSEEQRRQFGASVVTCYVFGNLMMMMHSESTYAYLTKYIGQNRISMFGFAAWCATIFMMFYLTFFEISIYVYMQCQCGLGLLHMVVAQFETVWFPAMGYQQAPDEVAGHPDDGKSQDELFKEELRDALHTNAGRIVDLFREMDEDGDGLVSIAEFRNVDTILGIGDVPDEVMDAIFHEWDEDGSGAIELDNLNTLLRDDGLAAKEGQ